MSPAATKATRAAGKPSGQAARSVSSERASMGPPVARGKADNARGTEEPTRRGPGRPAVAGARRDVAIEVPLTPGEKARWRAAATAAGLAMVDWVRVVVEANGFESRPKIILVPGTIEEPQWDR